MPFPADSALGALMATLPRPGQVRWIGLRPARDVPMQAVDRVEVVAGKGLVGDRYKSGSGKRGITLIQAEHLPVVAALSGLAEVSPATLRRNVVVSGLPVIALKGRRFRIGTAVFEGIWNLVISCSLALLGTVVLWDLHTAGGAAPAFASKLVWILPLALVAPWLGIKVLNTLRFAVDLTGPEPDLNYRGRPLSTYDAILPRIGNSITYFGTAVVRQFEQMDVFTPNTANGISNARDKLRATQILSRHGIGMPGFPPTTNTQIEH